MTNQNKWAIIANANQTDQAWMLSYLKDLNIIACDGAYDYVKTWGVTIDTILGDFDSTQHPTHSPRFVHTPDQNKTDLHKAIEYADKQGATEIIIFNALGNAMSHTLHNLRLLKRLYNPNRSLLMLHAIEETNDQYPSSGIESIQYIYNKTILLQGQINRSLSVFGLPNCIASSQGLTWNLNHTHLLFSDNDSSRNRLKQPNAALTIQGDGLIMMDTKITIQLSY